MSGGTQRDATEGGGAFWMARMTTRNTESFAYGATAAKALESLVEAWIVKYCAVSDAAPGHPWEMRDDIVLAEAGLGRGYVIGATDTAWFPKSLHGDHPSLEATWDALAERHGIAEAPRP